MQGPIFSRNVERGAADLAILLTRTAGLNGKGLVVTVEPTANQSAAHRSAFEIINKSYVPDFLNQDASGVAGITPRLLKRAICVFHSPIDALLARDHGHAGALEPLLHQQRQIDHPTAHVWAAGRKPDPDIASDRNQRLSDAAQPPLMREAHRLRSAAPPRRRLALPRILPRDEARRRAISATLAPGSQAAATSAASVHPSKIGASQCPK